MSSQLQITGDLKVKSLTGVLTASSGLVASVPLGAANGVATLAGDGKVPSSQLPSYVDDVVEVANFAALPAIGETGKIYITLDNNKIYRWTGSTYVEISSSSAVWGAITGTLSNQTDLQNALDAKVATSRTISTTSPLQGGGDLSANRTFSISQANTSTSGFLSSTDWNTFNGKQAALNGTGFVKATGTTISYDNSTYATTSALSAYLPLAGGTLTGALSGTSATFSGLLTANAYINNYNNQGALRLYNTASAFAGGIGNGAWVEGTATTDIAIFSANNMKFYAGGSSTSKMTITSGGNVLIGTTTDAGQKLQVNGTSIFSGLLTNYNVYNTQTSSYTLVIEDASKIVEMNVGSANTVTVPTNASVGFPIGTEITVMQYGAGVTTIASAGGVTINSKSNARIIANRYTGATLIKRGTDEWYLIGNIVV